MANWVYVYFQIQGRFVIVAGKAGEVVVKVSKDINADMIVTGTRGYGKIRRALLGSVSHYILHNAECPVVSVRKSVPI